MKFEQPAWFFAIALVPLLTIGAILTTRLRRRQWAAFVSPRLRSRLLRRGSSLPRWLAFGFLMAALILLSITLARPQTVRGTQVETTRGRNVLIALDLSRSMLAKDVKPDRLTQAKAMCNELIEAMPTDRIGVIGFSGAPYLYAPLTVDHASVRETVEQLNIDSIPIQGSNVYEALKMGVKTLKETGQKENALVLLTDGEETAEKMIAIADDAKKAGMYIFVVAFGTEQGDFIPDPKSADGHYHDRRTRQPVISKLTTDSLKTLTRESGGRLVVSTSASDIPDMVVAAVKDLEQFEIAGKERIVPVEHYQWFLLPGIFLLMASIVAGTRWKALAPVAALVTIFLFTSSQVARAAPDDAALSLLKSGKNQSAAQAYGKLADEHPDTGTAFRYRLAQGTAAYRAGNIESARKAFSEALRSSDPLVKAAAHHGLGNTLFQRGWQALSDDLPYPQTKTLDLGIDAGPFQGIVDGLLGKSPEGPKERDENDPMAPFDELIQQRIAAWLMEDVEEGEVGRNYQIFDSVISDWIDAVKHYDSAFAYNPKLDDSKSNRELDVKYLKRLQDLLDQVQQNAKMLGSGAGQGDEGADEEGEGQEGGRPGKGRNGRRPPKDKGKDGDKKDQQGDNGDKKDKNNGKGPEEGEKQSGGKPKKGETPEDTARRILRENSDFEQGAPLNNRLDYEQPDRDW